MLNLRGPKLTFAGILSIASLAAALGCVTSADSRAENLILNGIVLDGSTKEFVGQTVTVDLQYDAQAVVAVGVGYTFLNPGTYHAPLDMSFGTSGTLIGSYTVAADPSCVVPTQYVECDVYVDYNNTNGLPSVLSIGTSAYEPPSTPGFFLTLQYGYLSWTPKMRQLAKVEPCP